MYGVIKGFQSFNLEKDNELNSKIYQRNIPDKPLQPDLNIYPIQTKRMKMQVIDARTSQTCKKHKYEIFNIENNFNPGTAMAPWNGFATNVDVETNLRRPNSNCNINDIYIPSSSSDLYNSTVRDNNLGIKDHEILFKQDELSTVRQPYQNFSNIFNNNTRC